MQFEKFLFLIMFMLSRVKTVNYFLIVKKSYFYFFSTRWWLFIRLRLPCVFSVLHAIILYRASRRYHFLFPFIFCSFSRGSSHRHISPSRGIIIITFAYIHALRRCIIRDTTFEVIREILRAGKRGKVVCDVNLFHGVYRYLNKSDVTSSWELITRADGDKKP